MSCNDIVCGTGGWDGPKPGDPNNDIVLSAVGKPGGVELSWTYPTINPTAVSYYVVYRGVTNDFSASIRLGQTSGNYYFNKVPNDSLIEYFYWIVMTSVHATENAPIGPASATPLHGINSVDDLNGVVSHSSLSGDLADKLGKITELDLMFAEDKLARLNTESILTDALEQVQSDTGDALTFIRDEVNIRKEQHLAMIDQINALAVGVDDATTAIVHEEQVRAGLYEAVAGDVEVLQSRLGNIGGVTLEQAMEATVTADKGVEGYYMIKIKAENADGSKSAKGAFGLLVTPDGSTFAVDAETFKIASMQSNGEIHTPFLVDSSGIYLNGNVRINGTLKVGDLQEPLNGLGNSATPPDTTSLKRNTFYRNTTDGCTYILKTNGGAWELWLDNPHAKVKGICFLRSATVPTTPIGGSYSLPLADGWSDGVPSGKLPVYMTTRTFTSDGIGQDATWSTPVLTSSLGGNTRLTFSVDGSTNWHTTPSTNDVYMATQTSDDNGVTWTAPTGAVKIKGEAGVGKVKGISFIRATSTPATPTGGSYASPTPTTSGWSDGVPSGTNPVYMSSRTFTSDGLNQDAAWTVPVLTSALGQGTRNVFSTDNATWHTTPATNDIYMATQTSTDGGTTWGAATGSVKIKGEVGAQGIQGIQGNPGPQGIQGIQGNPGTPGSPGARGSQTISMPYAITSGSAAASAWSNFFSDSVKGDVVIGVDSSNGNRTWYRSGTDNGSYSWSEIATYISGNAVVTGTLYADRIVANSIYTDRISYGAVTSMVTDAKTNSVSVYTGLLTILQATITPSSSSSIINISFQVRGGTNMGDGGIEVFRNSTSLIQLPYPVFTTANYGSMCLQSMTYLDQPGTTSPVTYYIKLIAGSVVSSADKRALIVTEFKR